MVLFEKEEVLTNEEIWFIFVKILRFKEEFIRVELARELNILNTGKKFSQILNFLEQNDFMECDRERYPYKFKLKKKRLAKFLWNSEILKEDIKNLIKFNSLGGVSLDIT